MKAPPSERIAFIGAGNMAEALVRGLIDSGRATPSLLTAADPSEERRALFLERYQVRSTGDNRSAVREADVVVLAVKPQAMNGVLDHLREAAHGEPLWISIAAGIPTGRIEARLGAAARVVRAMPNTPALVGAGVTAICPGAQAGADDLARAEQLLTAVGRVVRVPESCMNAVTALSGSGPAYVFHIAEAWLNAAREMGLPRETARILVEETLAGAARLLVESGAAPEELRRQVTSPGGTTEAALRVLETHATGAAFAAAISAAARRAQELSELE